MTWHCFWAIYHQITACREFRCPRKTAITRTYHEAMIDWHDDHNPNCRTQTGKESGR